MGRKATTTTAYNATTHPVDLTGGTILAPLERAEVDPEDPHTAGLIEAGALVALPKGSSTRSSDDTTSTEEPA